jgi:hypothetical protein
MTKAIRINDNIWNLCNFSKFYISYHPTVLYPWHLCALDWQGNHWTLYTTADKELAYDLLLSIKDILEAERYKTPEEKKVPGSE